jgi:hypothetical protein
VTARGLTLHYGGDEARASPLSGQRWVPFDEETRALVKNALAQGAIEAVSMTGPARVRFVVPGEALVGATEAWLQLALVGFSREHVLGLAFGGNPEVVVPCTKPLRGGPVTGYGDRTVALRVRIDPAWLVAGRNEVRLWARVVPGIMPTVYFSVREVSVFLRAAGGGGGR